MRTVDHDALAAGDFRGAVRLVDEPADDAVYRGWMVRSEHYEALSKALGDRQVRLRTAPAAYQRAHELPGWYHAFAGVTPESRWLLDVSTEGLDGLLRELPAGPAIVKDYVKSMKHYWAEATYISNVEDADAALTVVRRFLQLRGDDLVGGVVLRHFERFVGEEVRTWWVQGTCRLVTAHPDSPDAAPPQKVPVHEISAAVAKLNSPFVTVDLAQREDHEWRVIEVGDGQVSDRPTSTEAAKLIAALQE